MVIIPTSKHHDQEQVEKKTVYLVCVSWTIVRWGKSRKEPKPGRNLEAGAIAEAMVQGWGGVLPPDLFLMAQSAWPTTDARTTAKKLYHPTEGYDLSHKLLIKKLPYRPAYILILWRHFPNWSSLH